MSPDIINALFIGFAAILSWLNVRAILKDRQAKGISPWVTVFFTVWGIWNLFYYPYLLQWWSAVAELGIVSVNAIWLWLFYRYRNDHTT